MARCLYNSTICAFLQLSPEALLGRFVNNYHGAALTTTNEAWNNEIRIIQEVLQPWMDEDGQVIFEYDIPRLGKRIDVVLLLRGLIFCLEFKVGERDMLQSNIEQVLDYALDLKKLSFAEPKQDHCPDSRAYPIPNKFKRVHSIGIQ